MLLQFFLCLIFVILSPDFSNKNFQIMANCFSACVSLTTYGTRYADSAKKIMCSAIVNEDPNARVSLNLILPSAGEDVMSEKWWIYTESVDFGDC